jgi:hypothetical protein
MATHEQNVRIERRISDFLVKQLYRRAKRAAEYHTAAGRG